VLVSPQTLLLPSSPIGSDWVRFLGGSVGNVVYWLSSWWD
jgi:hypothetical protein